jgi:hypothetical protein
MTTQDNNMKNLPLLIRVKDMKLEQNLINSKTLNKYFSVIDINLYTLMTDQLYRDIMLTKIKSYTCTKYKVLIILHGYIQGIDRYIEPIRLIDFLKLLDKPIEILNLACHGVYHTFINNLAKGSLIIDVANGGIINLPNFRHPDYSDENFKKNFIKMG